MKTTLGGGFVRLVAVTLLAGMFLPAGSGAYRS